MFGTQRANRKRSVVFVLAANRQVAANTRNHLFGRISVNSQFSIGFVIALVIGLAAGALWPRMSETRWSGSSSPSDNAQQIGFSDSGRGHRGQGAGLGRGRFQASMAVQRTENPSAKSRHGNGGCSGGCEASQSSAGSRGNGQGRGKGRAQGGWNRNRNVALVSKQNGHGKQRHQGGNAEVGGCQEANGQCSSKSGGNSHSGCSKSNQSSSSQGNSSGQHESCSDSGEAHRSSRSTGDERQGFGSGFGSGPGMGMGRGWGRGLYDFTEDSPEESSEQEGADEAQTTN